MKLRLKVSVMFRFQKSLLPVVISAAFLASGAGAQDLQLYSTAKAYQQLSKEKLGPDAKKRVAEFKREATYYGAIAIHVAEDVGGTTWGQHALANATQQALKSCKAKATDPSGCNVYAVSLPRGYRQVPGAVGLNQEATRTYTKGDMAKSLKENPYGAIAVNGQWSWGWGTSSTSLEDAKATALDWCRKASAEAKDSGNHFWVTKVATSRDWTCAVRLVVDSSQ